MLLAETNRLNFLIKIDQCKLQVNFFHRSKNIREASQETPYWDIQKYFLILGLPGGKLGISVIQ